MYLQKYGIIQVMDLKAPKIWIMEELQLRESIILMRLHKLQWIAHYLHQVKASS